MAVMAVTGDIGAGKSTAAKLLSESFSCRYFSADAIALDLWADDNVKNVAVSRWGSSILDVAGNIIRPEISRIIFTHKDEYKFCIDLLHPLVMSTLQKLTENLDAAVVEIPLLPEVGRSSWINHVIYATAPFELRYKRCEAQRGWSIDELTSRESFLMPQNLRMAGSDYIIRNDMDIAGLARQVANIFNDLHRRK